MTITPFTNIPGRGQDPSTFAARADNFLGVQLPRFVSEANETADDVNQAAASAAWYATAAEASADVAAAAIEGLDNYQGEWASLSGPLSVPASVRHNGRFWLLISNTPNVALSEPGVDVSRWQPVKRGMIVQQWNVYALHGDDIVHVNNDTRRVFLPAGPNEGDTVSVMSVGSGTTRVDRNGSTILGVDEDLFIDQIGRRVRFVYVGGTWRVSLEGLVA